MHPDNAETGGQDGRPAMEVFRRDARIESEMLKDGQPVTKAERAALVKDLGAYRDAHLVDKRPISIAKLSELVGVSPSVLSEWIKGTYRGDDDRVSRLVDQFLAREDRRDKGVRIRGFVAIRLVVEVVLAAIAQAVTRHSIAVVTAEPGSGKTTCARWYVERHDGAVLITASAKDCDSKFIIDALHAALVKTYTRFTRQKLRELLAHLPTHKNIIIFVDESHYLTPDALETLRCLFDGSDPAGERNVPIILFGDETFYALVVRSRGGERTPISPQITSRLFPVVSLERHGLQRDSDGQVVPESAYTKADIEAIVKNQRLRIVRPEAIAWATKLANLRRHGRLRLAARVLEIAIDIKRGGQVTVDDLRAALELFIGPSDARICVEEMQRAPTAVAMAG